MATHPGRERQLGRRTGQGAPHPAAAAIGALALAAMPHPARGYEELVERFTGTARGQDGAVLYLEDHAVRRTPERLLGATTTYRDPGGREIAVLRTDFSRDPFAPSYEFEDLRSGTTEAVDVSADVLALRAGKGSRTLPRPPEPARRLVTGQGLDRLVRTRLDAIETGEVLSLRYAVPARLDAYDMRVRAVDAEAAGATVRIRVEFSSWVLRLLAPSLDVEYDRKTRRILRYRGVSNLAGADSKNPEVEITYAYPQPGSMP
jgi:hypothetical protein